MSTTQLFTQGFLRDAIKQQWHTIKNELEHLDGARLLNSNIDEIVNYFYDKYALTCPILDEANITTSAEETKVDVRHDFNRAVMDRSRPALVDGTTYSYFIPYTGDQSLFFLSSDTYSLNPPRAEINNSEVVISITRTDHNAEEVKRQFNDMFNGIKEALAGLAKEVQEFNSSLKRELTGLFAARVKKLQNDATTAKSLGYPLKRREDAQATFALPVKRKKITQVPLGKASPAEPALEIEQYDDILSIISHMTQVMERSPHAFQTMGEEDLRQHFLVQLNGQYEGAATGETFNYEGKTDILIRVEGRNIFIGECKFWGGAQELLNTIDQILRYASWRDTKTCIILFNKNKNLSAVLKQIPGVVASHASFVRQLPYSSETGFRFTMRHRDDKDRELTMTVLVFDVPG